MTTNFSDDTRNVIRKVSANKIVAELAGGTGWASLAALEANAKFVKFSDARPERIEKFKFNNYQNYSTNFLDLNNPNLYKDFLNDVDLIIYCGHLYHSYNHKEILNFIIDSNANEFIINSKMFPYQDYGEPNIIWYDEPTNVVDKIYHPEKELVKVGWVNLSWVLDFLKSKNIEIIKIIKKRHWYLGPDPKFEFINFTIHCKKPNS